MVSSSYVDYTSMCGATTIESVLSANWKKYYDRHDGSSSILMTRSTFSTTSHCCIMLTKDEVKELINFATSVLRLENSQP